MNILVVTNLYPPYYIGGYELGCSRVVEDLRRRGHEVKVLTSTHGVNSPLVDGDVYRWIPVNIRFRTNRSLGRLFQFFWFDHCGRRVFRKLYDTFKPDIVYVWNMVHLPVSIVFLAQSLQAPVHFYVSDKWLANWERDGWYKVYLKINSLRFSVVKEFLKGLFHDSMSLFDRGLRLTNVQFISKFIKDDLQKTGKVLENPDVIHWGIDEKIFRYKERSEKRNLKLLYVGQVVEHKGVYILIEALNILVNEYGFKEILLSIAGEGFYQEYLQRLKQEVHTYKLEGNVLFMGFLSGDDLVAVYQNHDVLVFSSIWEEPFGIVLIEALSSGLGIVATGTGGSSEIINPGEDALTYSPEDPRDCANQIRQLYEDRTLLDTMRLAGRHTVEKRFRFDQMMDQVEDALQPGHLQSQQ
jgi:glycosyltransferase involved in cell wall biosynthesis